MAEFNCDFFRNFRRKKIILEGADWKNLGIIIDFYAFTLTCSRLRQFYEKSRFQCPKNLSQKLFVYKKLSNFQKLVLGPFLLMFSNILNLFAKQGAKIEKYYAFIHIFQWVQIITCFLILLDTLQPVIDSSCKNINIYLLTATIRDLFVQLFKPRCQFMFHILLYAYNWGRGQPHFCQSWLKWKILGIQAIFMQYFNFCKFMPMLLCAIRQHWQK